MYGGVDPRMMMMMGRGMPPGAAAAAMMRSPMHHFRPRFMWPTFSAFNGGELYNFQQETQLQMEDIKGGFPRWKRSGKYTSL